MLQKWKDRFIQSPLVKWVINWSKKTTLPGFQGIPIYETIVFIIKELRRDGIVIRSNSMAFSFFLSLFPSILFLVTLLPYLPIKNFVKTLNDSIFSIFPNEAALFLVETINGLINVEREGVLGLSLVLALFFASNGMLAMMRGFNKEIEISYKSRNIFQKRGTAIALTLVIGFLLITSLGLLIAGGILLSKLLEWTHLSRFNYNALIFLRWIFVIILIYMGTALIYHIGPALKNKLSIFSAGATLATILILVSSLGFTFFINNFARYNQVYGSISALIVVLLFLQINSFILLIGYELNASIAINRDLKAHAEGSNS